LPSEKTNNGGNFDLQNGTVSAALAGTNGVNKTTSGTVTLSGANTYTGTTTLSQGVLTITSNSSLPGIATDGRYSVANGATLALNVAGAGEFTLTQAATMFGNGIRKIYTLNGSDFRHFEGIEVLAP
jgi:autotransporter-associated beta strand protein